MISEKVHISIVIPLYNKEHAILDTLNTVLAQTYSNFECIIVNDGSTDHSCGVVESWIKKNSSNGERKFRLITKQNGGVSSARNAGIKDANYQYVALLDGDDIWDKTFLEEQLQLIEAFPKASMWGVNYAFVKGENCTPCNQGLGDGFRGYVENYFGTSHNDLFCSSSVVIRRDIFEKVGYFDERISASEDLDMWYRIILHNPVVYYDKVLAYYNQNAENRVAYDTDYRFPLSKSILYYVDKYHSEFQTNPVFSRYMNNYVAANLLKEGYYFGTRQERIDSDHVVKSLRYQDIHPKYRWIYLTPRWFGKIMYKIVCLKKKIR